MNWLDRIVQSFIMTFGITQPTPEKRKIANLFVGTLLFGMMFFFLMAVAFGVHSLLR